MTLPGASAVIPVDALPPVHVEPGDPVHKIKVAAVALANKTARIVWALMSSGERYRDPQIAPPVAPAVA